MSRAQIDLYRDFGPTVEREMYEAVYDVVNEVHYRASSKIAEQSGMSLEEFVDRYPSRKRGDISVPMLRTLNAGLDIEPDFDYELMIVEGSDNWPLINDPNRDHNSVKAILDDRAHRISGALRSIFPYSHGVMEIADIATGWATYEGNPELLVPIQ